MPVHWRKTGFCGPATSLHGTAPCRQASCGHLSTPKKDLHSTLWCHQGHLEARRELLAAQMEETAPLMLQRRLVGPSNGAGRLNVPKQKPIVLIDEAGARTCWHLPCVPWALCNRLPTCTRRCAMHAERRRADQPLPLPPPRRRLPPPPPPATRLPAAGHASYTTLRKQALVSELQLRHRDIRALDPSVQLPCEPPPPAEGYRLCSIPPHLPCWFLPLLCKPQPAPPLSAPPPHPPCKRRPLGHLHPPPGARAEPRGPEAADQQVRGAWSVVWLAGR